VSQESRGKYERIAGMVNYCPLSGLFTWKHDGSDAAKLGKNGRYLLVNGVLAHRLAFLIMEGRLPNVTDHIDGDCFNNKWENLRDCDQSINLRNKSRYRKNKSGISGVIWIEKTWGGHWRARIGINGKCTDLKATKDFFEACCARKSAENTYRYHPNDRR